MLILQNSKFDILLSLLLPNRFNDVFHNLHFIQNDGDILECDIDDISYLTHFIAIVIAIICDTGFLDIKYKNHSRAR